MITCTTRTLPLTFYLCYATIVAQSKEGTKIAVEKALRYVAIPAHQHEFIECAYVVRGSCVQKIDGNAYSHVPGDFVLVPSGASHEITVPEDSLCLTVKLRQETFVSMKVPNLPLFVVPLLFPTGEDGFALHTVLSIYEQQEGGRVYANELLEQLFCYGNHSGIPAQSC